MAWSATGEGQGVVADRFAVTGLLGSGGMGVVLRATDLRLGQEVALKVPRHARHLTHRLQLLAEATCARAVLHPHVVRVLSSGISRSGEPYLAMELVDGSPASRRLATDGRIAPAIVARIVRETAEALAALHERGIVHRDVKPSNLLLRDHDGSTVLIDFGLAVSCGAGAVHGVVAFTPGESGEVVGTPAYLAPEQARHGVSCTAGDQFALGVSAYEMLTGELPWRSPSPTQLVAAILLDEAPCASCVAPGLPGAVDRVLARALAKEPGDRYPDVLGFATALEAALETR